MADTGVVPRSILVVEDSEDLRDLIVLWLTGVGHRVTCAASAGEAHALLALRGFPDVLATDYHLNDGNGFDLARSFRRLKPGLPTLIFSGDLPSLPPESGVEVLLKPFGPAQLHEKLSRICG
jgi:CheY-like chemotaxis protein